MSFEPNDQPTNDSDCTLKEAGCTVESDLCDPEDDNGSLDQNLLAGDNDDHDDGLGEISSAVCTVEYDACMVRAWMSSWSDYFFFGSNPTVTGGKIAFVH